MSLSLEASPRKAYIVYGEVARRRIVHPKEVTGGKSVLSVLTCLSMHKSSRSQGLGSCLLFPGGKTLEAKSLPPPSSSAPVVLWGFYLSSSALRY